MKLAFLVMHLVVILGGAQAWAESAEHGSTQASCSQILAASQHRSAHAAEQPNVSETIFHHVTDSYTVSFDSPFSEKSLQFNFKNLECRLLGWNGVISVAGRELDITPTKHVFWMWISAAGLIILFWMGKPKKGQLVPKGLGNALEALVLLVRDDIVRQTIPGKSADKYTPYLLSCFFFILAMNLTGLIPYGSAATSNLGVTVGLALVTFVLTQIAGIRSVGLGGYIKHLTGGVHPALWPIMIPVEFLGLFTKPFALTIRLFANEIAGHIVIFYLLGLIFILQSLAIAPASVLFAFGIYLLEIFVALVQAYVFTMLSSLFIGLSVGMGSHGAEGETHH